MLFDSIFRKVRYFTVHYEYAHNAALYAVSPEK